MILPPTPIGIAVVEDGNRYLVGTRGETGPLPGRAEFPGGKCRPGESGRDAAVRECFEETGLRIEPVQELLRRTFTYPHGAVELHFWLCRPATGEPVQEEHDGFRWFPAEELPSLPFPEANGPVIELLQTPRAEPDR